MIKNLAIGGSNRSLLFLAFLLGLVFAVLVGVYLSSLDDSGGSSSGTATVPVVVAAQDIPPLTTISAEMLTLKEVPVDLVLTGSFAQAEQVVGKRTQVQIVTGEQLLTSNAIDASSAQEQYGPEAPLSLIVPEGKRAFSIYLSHVASVGGLARAGDHVDIFVSTSDTSGSTDGTDSGGSILGSACVALQDVEVLAVGETLKRAGTDSSAIAAVETNPDADSMTLAVAPGEALQLAAVQRSISGTNVGSQLWVSLRAFGDHAPADLPGCGVAS